MSNRSKYFVIYRLLNTLTYKIILGGICVLLVESCVLLRHGTSLGVTKSSPIIVYILQMALHRTIKLY